MCYCLRTVNSTLSLTCQLANAMQRGATSKEAPNQRQTRKIQSQDFPQKLFTSRLIPPGLEDKNYSQFTVLHPGFHPVRTVPIAPCSGADSCSSPLTINPEWAARRRRGLTGEMGSGFDVWRPILCSFLSPPMQTTRRDGVQTHDWTPGPESVRVEELCYERGSVCVLRWLRGREQFHTFH